LEYNNYVQKLAYIFEGNSNHHNLLRNRKECHLRQQCRWNLNVADNKIRRYRYNWQTVLSLLQSFKKRWYSYCSSACKSI